MKCTNKIYVAGHQGLVGSALVRVLLREGFTNLILKTRAELDLSQQAAVETFFHAEKPEHVFLAAARVGGIQANNVARADFIYENLIVECNVIHAAYKTCVRRLLFLGSACLYPKGAPQPLQEEYLLTGPLEPTNEPYAVAKIAGIKMCESYNRQYGTHFITVMPSNLYGPNDNFDLETSHVLPALIRKFCDARERGAPEVIVWGSGNVKREFLHVDDLAEACLLLMCRNDEVGPINIGSGTDLSITELVDLVCEEAGYRGRVSWDTSRPDGVSQKLLCPDRVRKLGWLPKISLRDGIRQTIAWYREQSSLKHVRI